MTNALLNAAATGFLSRIHTDSTHQLALRDVACFVLPQNASLSLSLAGPYPQGRVDYALYAPNHSQQVSWSQLSGFEVHATDTLFFSATGSMEPRSTSPRVELGELAATERYCLKTNYHHEREFLAPADPKLVLTVENGICLSNDHRAALLFLANIASSLLISTVAYRTCHSSMIIWRELSAVLFGFLCLPFVFYNTSLCLSLSSVLQNVLMVLYYPVHNTWTPVALILSLLEPVFGPDITTTAVSLLLLLRFVFCRGDSRYSSVGPVILFETMWGRYLLPLLLTRPFQQWFVSGLDTFLPNGYMCDYALEWAIFEVCLKSLLIVVALLLT